MYQKYAVPAASLPKMKKNVSKKGEQEEKKSSLDDAE
jgi:hypothetical protein